MQCPEPGERINSYALVTYIPGRLGTFLSEIRRELVCSCFAQSHVTILPPRSLAAGEEEVKEELTGALRDFGPFSIQLGDVQVFESTAVIYIGIESGKQQLKQLHDLLNRRGLCYPEPHSYHPHVTLAQDFPPQELPDMVDLARDRWSKFSAPRSFDVDSLTFVQNTSTNRWLDLAEYPLGDSVLLVR